MLEVYDTIQEVCFETAVRERERERERETLTRMAVRVCICMYVCVVHTGRLSQ